MMDPADSAVDALLLAQAHMLCADPLLRQVVWRHGAHLGEAADAARFDARIHAGDQMLLHSLKHHRDANASFSQYFNVALQQHDAAQQVLRALFPGKAERVSVLDFACGYGRLLRFLSLGLPRVNLHAAEVQPDALAFVCEHFGVEGHASPGTPDQFQPGRRFHFIWVASLFSHLPAALFDEWLARLVECLEPEGVLCFSVHDQCLLPDGHDFPASGFLFWPQSENDQLDNTSYGTSYVSHEHVAGAITRACGKGHRHFRIPRGLAHEQDVYVVPADPARDLSPLSSFRRGPWGWADERHVGDDGELYLRGWAASIDDGALDAVEITVDGVQHRCPTGGHRPDVGRVFADPRLDASGWEFRHVLSVGEGPVRVVVTARTAADERALIFTGLFDRPPGLPRRESWWRRFIG